jgi:uncharacterized OsmC-like protein
LSTLAAGVGHVADLQLTSSVEKIDLAVTAVQDGSMSERCGVTVATGSLKPEHGPVVEFPHRWTAEGVSVTTDFTGAHLLHLAAAGSVLNDVHCEAQKLDIPVKGVRVEATGGYDPDSWQSTGIEYTVHIDTPASREAVQRLLEVVDTVAEIPRAIRAGAPVRRCEATQP